MSWFSFKGKRCDESDVFCLLEKLPLDIRSEKITQIIEMPISEPIIYEPGGYKSQVITLTLGIKDISMEHIHNINNWLTGYGKLIFSNQPDRHYVAVCNNALSGQRLVEQLGKLPVQFTLMPFARENESEYVSVPLSNQHVGFINDATAATGGTAPMQPTIKLYGNGNLGFYHVASGTNITVHDVDTFCIIDVPSHRVFDKNNNVIMNKVEGNIEGVINPPRNGCQTNFSGDVTSVEVKYNRRWL